MTVNPLVAGASGAPKDAWAGVWIVEDIQLIEQGIKNGSWIDGTLGVVGAGLDALALISDPAGALLQYGIAWLIEHVKPLSDALDWLAGDPGQIAGHAQTWRNIANSLKATTDDLGTETGQSTQDWLGAAGDAYRTWANEQRQAVAGIAKAAETMATITEAAGVLIAAVRIMVRDAIATVVSRLVVYAVELLASLGTATPLVFEQVTVLVASWGARIARWLRALLASLRRLMPIIRRLGALIDELKRILTRLRSGSSTPYLARGGDGVWRNGTKILMTMDNVRAIAAKYGIDLRGVRISIDKVRKGPPGKPIYGMTLPNGKVILTRDAFMDEEQLARTLAHERFHVDELRQGARFPMTDAAKEPWEARAKAFEDQWWEQHKHLIGGE
jgi:uncharacterized protein YukE